MIEGKGHFKAIDAELACQNRRPRVVEVRDVLAARGLRAGSGDVDAHGLRAAIIKL